MHLEAQTQRRRETVTSRVTRWLAILFPFSMVGSAFGQTMLPPPPGFQGAPSVPQLGVPSGSGPQLNGQVNNEINAGQTTGEGAPATTTGEEGTPAEGNARGKGGVGVPTATESLMQWGVLHLHAAASYQFLYDSEVHTQPGESTATMSHSFAFPFTALIGPHLTLSYTPSYRIFTAAGFHNTLDHSASLTAGIGYGNWTFGLSQGFSRTDEPLIETSAQTGQDNYATSVNVGYRLTDKMSLSTSGSMDLNYLTGNNLTNVFVIGGTNSPAPLANSSKSYSGSEWVNYQIDERLSTGVGITFEYSDQSGGFKSIDQQYQAHFSWHSGDKINFDMMGGLEIQEFLDTDTPNNVSPILTATLNYQPLAHTSFSLFADRQVNPSVFEQQISEVTAIGIGFQQRLLGLLSFSAGFSYSTSDFKVVAGDLTTTRSDRVQAYTTGLSMPILKRGTASVFYSYQKDNSSQAGFSFNSSEVGATVSWSY